MFVQTPLTRCLISIILTVVVAGLLGGCVIDTEENCSAIGCAEQCAPWETPAVGEDGCGTCECVALTCGPESPCPDSTQCLDGTCIPDDEPILCPACAVQCAPWETEVVDDRGCPACRCAPRACDANTACPDGAQCADGACAPTEEPPICRQCDVLCVPWEAPVFDDQGCPTCVCGPMACSPDSPCAEGAACQNGLCVEVPEPMCRVNADCPGNGTCLDGHCGCACPAVEAPVCGTDGETYGNDCMAACAGIEIERFGPCDPADCQCPDVLAPVCGDDGQTYDNQCSAACAGVHALEDGPCPGTPPDPCECPGIYAPVCGQDGETYENPCLARCEAIEIHHDGACEIPCHFPRERPVSDEECAHIGGRWEDVGGSGRQSCSLPTCDAGTPCRDSDQCNGYCQAPEGAEVGDAVEGICFGFDRAVCLREVRNGVAEPQWCH